GLQPQDLVRERVRLAERADALQLPDRCLELRDAFLTLAGLDERLAEAAQNLGIRGVGLVALTKGGDARGQPVRRVRRLLDGDRMRLARDTLRLPRIRCWSRTLVLTCSERLLGADERQLDIRLFDLE